MSGTVHTVSDLLYTDIEEQLAGPEFWLGNGRAGLLEAGTELCQVIDMKLKQRNKHPIHMNGEAEIICHRNSDTEVYLTVDI